MDADGLDQVLLLPCCNYSRPNKNMRRKESRCRHLVIVVVAIMFMKDSKVCVWMRVSLYFVPSWEKTHLHKIFGRWILWSEDGVGNFYRAVVVGVLAPTPTHLSCVLVYAVCICETINFGVCSSELPVYVLCSRTFFIILSPFSSPSSSWTRVTAWPL